MCKQKSNKNRNVDRKFAEQLNFKGGKFTVLKKDYAKIEKRINNSIKLYGHENETSYCIFTLSQILKNIYVKNVDLLQISKDKNSHYVLIKDFNRSMTSKTKYHGRKHFSRHCLRYSSSSRVLECHTKSCLAINQTKSL